MASRDTACLVMLGTDFSSPGGITAVIRAYQEAGLFERWPVRFLPTYRRNTLGDKLLTAAKALGQFSLWLVRGEIGGVHAHVAGRGSFWRKSAFLWLASLGGASTVFHLHDGSFPAWFGGRSRLARQLILATLRRVDRVVVLTPSWAAWVKRVEPAACTLVIGNPVALPERSRETLPARILFLGRLWQEKGIFDLVEALAIVKKEIPDLIAVCAGDGVRAEVLAKARALGIADCLRLPGWIDGAEKTAELRQASVFVLPSYFEGLPMGVLEAMAQGVPVVATEVGGVRDALGNDAGLLIRPGDVSALAEALLAILRDRALRERMGEAGRQRVEAEYASPRVMKKLDDLYLELRLARPAGADCRITSH